MFYELRFYSVAPGRMQDVQDSFGVHFPALFAKHGINVVARWSAVAGPQAPRFCYLVAFRDFAHREAAWAGFRVDPDVARIRDETDAAQDMVEQIEMIFLKPNVLWAPDATADAVVGGLHEIVLQEIAPGQQMKINGFLKETWLPAIRDAGAQVLGIFDVASGAGMPKIALINVWQDAAAWHAGKSRMDGNADLQRAFASLRQTGSSVAPLKRTEVNLLEPAPGMTVHAGLGRGA